MERLCRAVCWKWVNSDLFKQFYYRGTAVSVVGGKKTRKEEEKKEITSQSVMTKIFVPVFEKMWSQEERFWRVRHWRGDFQRGAACCFNDFISKAHYFFLRRSHYSRILLAWPEESVRQRSENWQLPKDKWPIKKHTNKSGLIELKTQSLYLDQAIMSKWGCLFF